MKKRFIALFVIFAMLVPLTPAVAADDTVPRPTVEEILSEYHQKAFEAEAVGETATASTYSRSGSSGKTLEQETVDTLNAAGYEAYNVTAENFEALEAQLQTDFADMGLDPDGSYIVVISGENSENLNTAPGISPRVFIPQEPDNTGEIIPFDYTYNNITYRMRYLTVTAADNPDFTQGTTVDLLETYSENLLNNLLNTAATLYVDAITEPVNLGTLMSLFGLNINSSYTTRNSALALQGLTVWTRNYIQIWEEYDEAWIYASCSEYAFSTSKYSGLVRNASTNSPTSIDETIEKIIYSENYHNTDQQKIDAVFGYLEHDVRYDVTGNISYYHGNKLQFTHYEDYI